MTRSKRKPKTKLKQIKLDEMENRNDWLIDDYSELYVENDDIYNIN